MSKYYLTTGAAMRYYMLAMESGDREVGGFFEFHIDKDDDTIITDLTVLRQDASYAHFTIDAKVKALWLEKIVGEGKDPSNFGLFHTHPTGMGSSMSGVDVKQIEEMATDLPGVVARSMILSQGKMHPTMNEALYHDGRVWRRNDLTVSLLDETNAINDLTDIGWFEKPKPVAPQRTGFTSLYAQGGQRSRELVPAPSTRQFSANDGWFDEYPESSELPAGGGWLDDTYAKPMSAATKDEVESYIGCDVTHQGVTATVIDAYDWDGDIVLILPDNTELLLEDAQFATR